MSLFDLYRGQPVEVLTTEAILQAQEGRTRGQRSDFVQRRTPSANLNTGSRRRLLASLPRRHSRRHVDRSVAQQIDDAVLDGGRMPAIMDRVSQAADQPALRFDAA